MRAQMRIIDAQAQAQCFNSYSSANTHTSMGTHRETRIKMTSRFEYITNVNDGKYTGCSCPLPKFYSSAKWTIFLVGLYPAGLFKSVKFFPKVTLNHTQSYKNARDDKHFL